MLWPEVDEIRRAPWAGEAAWDGGPGCGDVVVVLRPALRALFLLGHRTRSINLTVGRSGDESPDWWTLDLETFAATTAPAPYDDPRDGLNVAFDLAWLGDDSGHAPAGYAMAPPGVSIGTDDAQATGGKIPEALEASVEGFVEPAVATLAGLVGPRFSHPPRADGQGLLWVFDPDAWWGVDAARIHAAAVLDVLTDDPTGFLRGQIYDDRARQVRGVHLQRTPTVHWLLSLVGRRFAGSSLCDALFLALHGRGAAELLTGDARRRLSWPGSAPSWLDALVELFETGAIGVDNLLEVEPPVDPLVASALAEDELTLRVWDERTITLRRVVPCLGKLDLEGSVAHEYVPSSAGVLPRVVVVAGRGVEIVHDQDADPWALEIFRVQDDARVPPAGAAIDPASLLSASLLDPDGDEYDPATAPVRSLQYPRLLAKPKPDGVYLEYPVFGTSVEGAGPSYDAVAVGELLPFAMELTVNPLSPYDGYTLGVHYFTERSFPSFPMGAAHLCIWTSEDVQITTNGRRIAANAVGEGIPMAWSVSAELWRIDPIGFRRLNVPFAAALEMTTALAYHGDDISAAVPRFPADGPPHLFHDADGDLVAVLVPRGYVHKDYGFEDSILFDLFDFFFGFVPFVGDAADIAETAYIWATGYDKWGRPVSNFDLALRTIGAAVPLVSSAMVLRAGEVLGAAALVRGVDLFDLFARFLRSEDVDETLVENALTASAAWAGDRRLSSAGKQELVEEMVGFLATHQDVVTRWVDRVVLASGDEWLCLPDLLDDAGVEFVLGPIQEQFRKWKVKHPGGRPEDFIASAPSGRARVLLQALLGPAGVGKPVRKARRAAQLARYPSHLGRAPRPGLLVDVLEIDETGFVAEVNAHFTRALAPRSRNKIASAGALRYARDVLARPPEFFPDGAATLLRYAFPDGLESADAVAMSRLLGPDEIGETAISMEERAARFGDALLTAAAELESRGIDAAELFTPEMLPATAAYVRKFIAGVGFENGSRFELTMAALFERDLRGAVQGLRYQLPLPLLLQDSVSYGPDAVIYLGGRAHLAQFKATFKLEDLAFGPIRYATDELNNVRWADGPYFQRQTFTDAARTKHWGHRVPGAAMPDPTAVLPAGFAGWADLADVHPLVFDDLHFTDVMRELLLDAQRRTGKTVVDVTKDVVAPDAVRDWLVIGLANNPHADLSDEAAVTATLTRFLENIRPELERQVNEVMSDPDVVDVVGRRFSYVVSYASEGPAAMLARLQAAVAATP